VEFAQEGTLEPAGSLEHIFFALLNEGLDVSRLNRGFLELDEF
jgi:hypothetical protein